MAEFPALNFWTDSWLADTAHLPRVDRDIYLHLIILMWRTPGCRVPAEIPWIARKLKCTESDTEILKSVIAEFCHLDGNWITQKRLTKEYELALKRSRSATDNAKSRWQKDKVSCGGSANNIGVSNATTTTTTTTTIKKEEDGISLARARDPLAELETKLRDAAGWQSEPAPMLGVTGPIQAIIAAGADLDLDVLPTVKALAPSARSRTTWKYFLSAIAQARDDRVAASKIVSPQISGQPGGAKNGNHRPEPALSPRQATIANLKRRAIEARLREIGESGYDGGPDIQGPTGDKGGKSGLSRRPN